jgi:putative membrane protein
MSLILKKNDKRAKLFIYLVSIIIFAAIVMLGRIELDVDLGFDEHVFAKANAIINSTVALLLLLGLFAAKNGKYERHKKLMLTAIFLSLLFLISYICHHLFAGDTKFGGEGSIRYFYFFILITHIILAAIILPFILFTAYRALINENERHRKIAKITWPIWFYVAVTGPIIYLMISPYY